MCRVHERNNHGLSPIMQVTNMSLCHKFSLDLNNQIVLYHVLPSQTTYWHQGFSQVGADSLHYSHRS